MTTASDLLIDAFGRIPAGVKGAVRGLSTEQLAERLDDGANSVGWLVWHLARGEDAQVSEVSGLPQVWTSQGWDEKFALPFSPDDTGYGHSPSDVAAVRDLPADLFVGYAEAVSAQSLSYLESLDEDDLDRVVDPSWNPPVTLGVRLVSVVGDDLEHIGQAAFIRGILLRR